MESSPHTCNVHPQYDSMIRDLKDTAKALMEGQVELKMTLIQLTENLKGLERLERRVDRLEDDHKVEEREQESKIDVLRVFMYKVVGAIAVLAFLGPIVAKIGMVMIL